MQKIRKYVVTALAVLFSLAIWLVMSARAVNVRVIIEYDGEYDQDSAQMFFNQGNGFELESYIESSKKYSERIYIPVRKE